MASGAGFPYPFILCYAVSTRLRASSFVISVLRCNIHVCRAARCCVIAGAGLMSLILHQLLPEPKRNRQQEIEKRCTIHS